MSYRLKLIITISLLIAVSFGIGGTLMITTSFQATLEQETQAALNAFQNLQNTLYLVYSLGDLSDFSPMTDALRQMDAQGMGQWQALSLKAGEEYLFRSGSMALFSVPLPTPAANHCSYLPVADREGHGLIVKSILTAGDAPLELLARFDVSSAYSIRQTQQRQYVIVYVAVVLFGILASAALSFALTRQLHRLTVTVRKIAEGDLSKRSRLRANDEFGQLSKAFDAMTDKLQENIGHLESQMLQQERFMGAFAHELKTPMTSIIGFADLLRQGNLDENTRMMAAQYIYSEGHRLERLSFKLLDLLLLEKDEVQLRPISLVPFLTQIEQALSPGLKSKGIRMIFKADHARVILEPDLVKSLLYNLVDNASKALDSGGIIALRATATVQGCQFQVADNGRGMEPEALSHITEAFYRVDKVRSRSQGGAGLGLALCKRIVELHRGTIHFASIPGKGTRVTVTLCTGVEERQEGGSHS
jgi:signal transduction histidine kinase